MVYSKCIFAVSLVARTLKKTFHPIVQTLLYNDPTKFYEILLKNNICEYLNLSVEQKKNCKYVQKFGGWVTQLFINVSLNIYWCSQADYGNIYQSFNFNSLRRDEVLSCKIALIMKVRQPSSEHLCHKEALSINLILQTTDYFE